MSTLTINPLIPFLFILGKIIDAMFRRIDPNRIAEEAWKQRAEEINEVNKEIMNHNQRVEELVALGLVTGIRGRLKGFYSVCKYCHTTNSLQERCLYNINGPSLAFLNLPTLDLSTPENTFYKCVVCGEEQDDWMPHLKKLETIDSKNSKKWIEEVLLEVGIIEWAPGKYRRTIFGH